MLGKVQLIILCIYSLYGRIVMYCQVNSPELLDDRKRLYFYSSVNQNLQKKVKNDSLIMFHVRHIAFFLPSTTESDVEEVLSHEEFKFSKRLLWACQRKHKDSEKWGSASAARPRYEAVAQSSRGKLQVILATETQIWLTIGTEAVCSGEWAGGKWVQ